MPVENRPSIRPSQPDDAEPFADLMEEVAAEGRWIARESPIDRPATIESFLTGIDDDDHGSFACVDGETLVGSLGVHLLPYGVAELGMLLAPSHRGRGLGRQLLDTALGWATDHPGVHKLALQHWPDNVAAHRLYRRAGFVQEGYLHRHYRRRNGELWDAVVMGLVLGEPVEPPN